MDEKVGLKLGPEYRPLSQLLRRLRQENKSPSLPVLQREFTTSLGKVSGFCLKINRKVAGRYSSKVKHLPIQQGVWDVTQWYNARLDSPSVGLGVWSGERVLDLPYSIPNSKT